MFTITLQLYTSCRSILTVGFLQAKEGAIQNPAVLADDLVSSVPELSRLYYTMLYRTILYYTILYYDILYYTILYYIILYYTIVIWYTACYIMLCYMIYHTILYYSHIVYSGEAKRGWKNQANTHASAPKAFKACVNPAPAHLGMLQLRREIS